MPPAVKKSSQRPRKRACSRKENVRTASEARLTRILGSLSRTAEDALVSQDLSEKTKKKIERVCQLARTALEQQPTRLAEEPPARAPKKR